MKKMIFFFIIISILLINIKGKEEIEEDRGVFISYIELSREIKGKDIKTAQNNIDKMILNIRDLKLNMIILQVRPSCDAIYKSKIYPYSLYVVEKEGDTTFDILDYFIKKAHEYKIKLIAWINPYRIRTTEDINTITEYSPAYSYLNTDTIYIKNGIYWNPSKEIVTNLIVKGVEEVLNYNVDGILFDDYFYPSSDIDQKDYELYRNTNSNISLEEYHLKVINNMIEKVYKLCKSKNIKFGISPDGNIDNNYKVHYADVKKWMSTNNYIDFIMPQIYYGFYNSTKSYYKTTKEWESLLTNKHIDLYIALAFYKIGKEDRYAREGIREWIDSNNIIMREVFLSRNLNQYKGFVLFRYDNVFKTDVNQNSKIELENLKRIMK